MSLDSKTPATPESEYVFRIKSSDREIHVAVTRAAADINKKGRGLVRATVKKAEPGVSLFIVSYHYLGGGTIAKAVLKQFRKTLTKRDPNVVIEYEGDKRGEKDERKFTLSEKWKKLKKGSSSALVE